MSTGPPLGKAHNLCEQYQSFEGWTALGGKLHEKIAEL